MTLIAISNLCPGMVLGEDLRFGSHEGVPHLRRGQEITPERLDRIRRAGLLVVDITLGGDRVVRATPSRVRPIGPLAALGAHLVPTARLTAGAIAGRGVRRLDGSLVPLGTPMDHALVDEIKGAGAHEVSVIVGDLARSRWVATPPARMRARVLQEIIRSSLTREPPEAYAASPDVGRAAAAALERTVHTVSWFAPIAELLVARGLTHGFLSAAMDRALLAAITGAHMGLADEELSDLALAAFLVDVGMLTLPRYYTEKPGRLSRMERRMMESHVERGAELLAPLGRVCPIVPLVVAEHHEMADGTGYPAGLRGREVRPEAQIVAVCQRYLAATSDRTYRAAATAQEAYELLHTLAGTVADPEVVEAFRHALTPFPAGALVRLSDGRGGRVVDDGSPWRPRVEVLWDADGEPVRRQLVDLGKELTVFITGLTGPAVAEGAPGLGSRVVARPHQEAAGHPAQP